MPVAPSQAGAVIGRGRPYPSYQSYLDRLDQVPIEDLLPRAAGDPYPRGAAAAILISWTISPRLTWTAGFVHVPPPVRHRSGSSTR
jgi:hypothetical protein